MKVLSPERMAKYDEYAIKTWGIPSAVLMENAGRGLYRLLREYYLKERKRILVVCGKGNNGGDGFVVARYAIRDGFPVKVLLLGKKEELKGDAALNMRLFQSIGGEIIEGGGKEADVKEEINRGDIVVDAIFGTGLSKPIEGLEAMVIEEINRSQKKVIAVDIPSGIDGKRGLVMGCAIKADHTFTFAYPKLGHLLYPGAYYAGRLTVIDISIPDFIENRLGFDGYIIDGELMRGIIKERLPWSHKGSFGHVAVIAGSTGKTGAAHMAALSALKIGAGLVTLLIPETLNPIMEMKLTEVMTYPVMDGGTGHFILSSYGQISEFIKDKDVVIIGPGLSQNSGTMELVRKLFLNTEKPFVIDADGINAFQGHLDEINKAKGKAVFTPHPGELGRLIGLTPKEINEDRIHVGRIFAKKSGIHLVLKGAKTLVFNPEGEVYINPTGNPALAKGGSGDVLTGFIGGLISQGYSPLEASIAGVYLHGYIADRWVEHHSDMDLIACELLSDIGIAVKELRDGKERVYIERSL
ncbi:MAG: NAD(P)H-hydrate dehydratase [Syntrophorhabdaceae bacterium]|nr:NAD(P)H-hydrate dehydratase [Syntrophorhabdaceae bacterium]